MTALVLGMQFATSARFGTGAGAGVLDETIDHMAPLSQAAIKGVLRDEARWLLPGQHDTDHPFVAAVFGADRGAQCPWNFDVHPVEEVKYSRRASIRLDKNGTVIDGALLVKEEAWIRSARVEITMRSMLSGGGLPVELAEQECECHLALLHLSARAAEKVGQRRTRGMGWVAFTCDRSVPDDLDLVWQIRESVI